MDEIYASPKRIEKLKMRAKRCVCKYCGRKLRLKQIVFNDIDEARVEIFCDTCNSIEFGVEPELYQCAVDFVENVEFNCFEDMDENEKTRRMNVAKVCDILTWSYKNMGFLGSAGFQIPENIQLKKWAECVVCEEDEIDSSNNFEDYLEEFTCQ